MARGKFAVDKWALLGTAGLLTNLAVAHDVAQRLDGCEVLAEIVYTEVTAAVWQGPGGPAFALPDPARAEVAACGRTTETVSRAFRSAMQAVGAHVTWSSRRDPRGEACHDGYLEQCGLDGAPYPPLTLDGWGVDVLGSWSAVQSAVRNAMPEGSATDRSIFSRESMQRALRQSLNGQHSGLRRRALR